MKLYYNKNSKDPVYYVQQGYRNGKKVTTKILALADTMNSLRTKRIHLHW